MFLSFCVPVALCFSTFESTDWDSLVFLPCDVGSGKLWAVSPRFLVQFCLSLIDGYYWLVLPRLRFGLGFSYTCISLFELSVHCAVARYCFRRIYLVNGRMLLGVNDKKFSVCPWHQFTVGRSICNVTNDRFHHDWSLLTNTSSFVKKTVFSSSRSS